MYKPIGWKNRAVEYARKAKGQGLCILNQLLAKWTIRERL